MKIIIIGVWLLLGFMGTLWAMKIEEITEDDVQKENPFMYWFCVFLDFIMLVCSTVAYFEKYGFEAFRFLRHPWAWIANKMNPLIKEKCEEREV